MSFFRVFKIAKVYFFLICCYLGLIIIVSFEHSYAQIAAFIVGLWFMFIFSIELMVSFAKVYYPIIKLISVDVVNSPIRPFTINIKPSKPMGRVFSLVYSIANADIKIFVPVSGIDTTNQPSAPLSATRINNKVAFKNTCFRAIMEFRLKLFLGNHLALRNSFFECAGNPLITATKRLANPVPTTCILT